MKLLKNVLFAGCITLSTFNVASAAPILNVDSSNNTLLGASGVNVGGTLYDVSFADGLINANAITAFTTSSQAALASQALLDQVLLGAYDDHTFKTNGCLSDSDCIILTTFSYVSSVGSHYFAYNSKLNSSDFISPFGTGTFSTAIDPTFTLARWTLSATVTPVPETETFAMLFAGLGLLGFVSRRRT